MNENVAVSHGLTIVSLYETGVKVGLHPEVETTFIVIVYSPTSAVFTELTVCVKKSAEKLTADVGVEIEAECVKLVQLG